MMHHGLRFTLSIAGAWLLLSGCVDNSKVFDQQKVLEAEEWLQRDTLTFQIDDLQPAQTYRYTLNGRLRSSYPFTEMDVRVHLLGHTEQVTLHPTSSERPLTQAIFYQPISSDTLTFHPDSTSITIQIAHGMRRERLKGIQNIGVQVFY